MKFCGQCGTRLASGCPACAFQNPPGMRFCGECGTPLSAAPAAAASAGPGLPAPTLAPAPADRPAAAQATERRLVSVLFADLVGFTARSDASDPEQVREFLARYFDLAREIVERYDGTVEKFIGDAVMAVWGTPVAREDDAERAVRAGLELVDAIRHLGRQSGDEALALRAGALTGEAAVAIGAVGQGMVAGDLVNTASRLQSVAPPGTVLVGEATKRAASGAIVFEEAGDQLLKGKAAPRSPHGGRCGSSPSAAASGARKGSRRPSWAATTSCASSRTSSTPRPGSGASASCRSPGRAASARAVSPGSSSSISTA
jgi:class 3 adenylate cyclase